MAWPDLGASLDPDCVGTGSQGGQESLPGCSLHQRRARVYDLTHSMPCGHLPTGSLCPPSQLPLSCRGIWEAEETRNYPRKNLPFLKVYVLMATSWSRSPWWRWHVVVVGGGKRGFCVQRNWGNISYSGHSLHFFTPFIKPISILKAGRNPSVQSVVSYLTQCFPHSLIHPFSD